jgi:hypothetical protein
MAPKYTSMCPATTSTSAPDAPLYGTWIIFTPAMVLNSSPARWCGLPMPVEP